MPRELLTNEVQESQTDTPEFQVYGDNRFYVERTFDTNLRLDQPFAPREDDCQEFEETLQPEPEVQWNRVNLITHIVKPITFKSKDITKHWRKFI